MPVKINIGLVAGTGWAVRSSIMGWSDFTLDRTRRSVTTSSTCIFRVGMIAISLELFSTITSVSGLGDTSNLGRTGLGMITLRCGSSHSQGKKLFTDPLVTTPR